MDTPWKDVLWQQLGAAIKAALWACPLKRRHTMWYAFP